MKPSILLCAAGLIAPMAFASASDGTVTVAILDSGMNARASFLGNRSFLWRDGALDSQTPDDDVGHGTAVASVLALQAPSANLAIYRFYSRDVPATVDGLHAAIEWSTKVARADITIVAQWIRVPTPEAAVSLNHALEAAERSGNVVLWAAGNGVNGIGLPPSDILPGADSEHAIVVGAANNTGHPQAWSNLAPDFLAPGVDVLTEGLFGEPEFRTGSSFATAWAGGLLAEIAQFSVLDTCHSRGVLKLSATDRLAIPAAVEGYGFLASDSYERAVAAFADAPCVGSSDPMRGAATLVLDRTSGLV